MNIDNIFKIKGLSDLENLAYRLYWNDNDRIYMTSTNFIKNKNEYADYYEKANFLLRKRKLKKLNEYEK
jgi:hypothetical protein